MSVPIEEFEDADSQKIGLVRDLAREFDVKIQVWDTDRINLLKGIFGPSDMKVGFFVPGLWFLPLPIPLTRGGIVVLEKRAFDLSLDTIELVTLHEIGHAMHLRHCGRLSLFSWRAEGMAEMFTLMHFTGNYRDYCRSWAEIILCSKLRGTASFDEIISGEFDPEVML